MRFIIISLSQKFTSIIVVDVTDRMIGEVLKEEVSNVDIKRLDDKRTPLSARPRQAKRTENNTQDKIGE